MRKDPLVGIVLDSKYKLLERLGEGGMGAVYRAQRLHIGDEVAVKLLHKNLLIDEHAIERFRREARSAAMIRHHNIVSIHDFNDASEHGSIAYIVMELVKGESLRQLLQREIRLEPHRAVALMRDICAGVGMAHRQGLLHRDLKPDNVIVTPPSTEGEPETAKVVDFGLAKLRDVGGAGLTQTGAVIGTLFYMSPEQCNSEDLDARSDVYSLGAMLFEMLAGVPPFQANNLAALISKHLHQPPPPFNESLSIPTALKAACYRALAKNRNDRQPDATAFSKEIQNALADSHPHAVSNSTAPTVVVTDNHTAGRQSDSKRGLKWVIGGIAAIVVFGFLLVVVGVALRFGNRIFNVQPNGNANRTARQEKPVIENENREEVGPSPEESTQATTPVSDKDLRGTWSGTYGNLGEPARLIVKTQKNGTFEGVIEQGDVQVGFNGTLDQTRHLTMKQTKVIKGSVSAWSLGTDSGTLSADGKQMSGTGKDEMSGQLGLVYRWSFHRE